MCAYAVVRGEVEEIWFLFHIDGSGELITKIMGSGRYGMRHIGDRPHFWTCGLDA